jgi:S1-C subfamily serine protease
MRQNLVILLVGLFLGAMGLAWLDARRAGAPPPPPPVLPAADDLTAGEDRLIALFEASKASVVSITTATQVIDPFSRRRHEVPQGTGSGIVWDDRGHILTNNHVIEGASAAQVRLSDGRSVPARLVGTDPARDMAVLRIAVDDLPAPLPRGSSAGLRVGQAVLAIGNPFGLDWTLTTGIVSALDREIPTDRGQVIGGLVQTDAAINPGNSGGPLIDSAGRLIGMNTAIFSPSGSSAGIGFAVPVDMAARVVPQLIRTGRYQPPTLGVVEDERINSLARRQGIEGVVVLDIVPGGPADRAGLRPARTDRAGRIVPGDILVAVDGRPVSGSADLALALDAHAPGDSVVLRVRRDGSLLDVPLTLSAE